MKKVINTATRSVTFTFEGLEPVTMQAERMSAANYDYACLHGLAARIGDNAAITKSAENGFSVTEAMRREAVLELVTFYEDPENKDWNIKQAARKPSFNPAIQAIADKLGKSYEEAMAWYNAKLMAELAAM